MHLKKSSCKNLVCLRAVLRGMKRDGVCGFILRK